MSKTILLLISLVITSTSWGQDSLRAVLELYNSKSVPYISVSELRMHQVNGEVVILDAREREEYEVSHIQGARFVGYQNFSAEGILDANMDLDAPLVVYCTLGIRSETIGEKLQKLGFTQVHNLYGGIIAWKNKAYPVIDPEGNETEKVHTNSRFWGHWLENGEKVY
ncbi:MAG: rhodanese-like domain-containing protein [Flavobacteriaceae bacterium]|nr:rhodanese-like domain-containing protein [Flavobacteriaceae bacterium]